MCKFAGLGRLWLFSRFYSHLLGRFCGCLWFSGYVNFVEIFGFVIVGFSGFAGFGGLQWQWVCDCLLRWVEIVGLSCGRRMLALVSLLVVVVVVAGRGFDGERKREKCDVYIIILFNCVIYIILLSSI